MYRKSKPCQQPVSEEGGLMRFHPFLKVYVGYRLMVEKETFPSVL